LLDMDKCWVRLANQTQRYFVLKNARSSEKLKSGPMEDDQPQKTGPLGL
jgi:hypothetical protein